MEIAPGTYFLDHHQRVREYDHFRIEVPGGRRLVARQTAHQVNVRITGDTFEENVFPHDSCAGVSVHDANGRQLDSGSVIRGGDTAIASRQVATTNAGTFYVLVGSNICDVHRASPFTIELEDAGDVGTGSDAGETDDEALALSPGAHRSWFQRARDERRDTYVFDAVPGGTYGLRVRPQAQMTMTLEVYDDDGVRLGQAQAPNSGAAVRVEGLTVDRAQRLFVRVENHNVDPFEYDIELTAEGVPAAAAPETAAASGATTDGEGSAAGEAGESGAVGADDAVPGSTGLRSLLIAALLVVTLGGVAAAVLLSRRRRARGDDA